jgi:tripartite-type tricarboxylate transporter receptor subunit TctC
MVQLPFVLVANPKVPASTFPELIAYARAHPDKVNFPSPGIGSPPHLFGEMLKTRADIRLCTCPTKVWSLRSMIFSGAILNSCSTN